MIRKALMLLGIGLLTSGSARPYNGEFTDCTPRSVHIRDAFPATCLGGQGHIRKESTWKIDWPNWYAIVVTTGFGGCFEGRECWPEFWSPVGRPDGLWLQRIIHKQPTLDGCEPVGMPEDADIVTTVIRTNGKAKKRITNG
jgi:hypothetical protein